MSPGCAPLWRFNPSARAPVQRANNASAGDGKLDPALVPAQRRRWQPDPEAEPARCAEGSASWSRTLAGLSDGRDRRNASGKPDEAGQKALPDNVITWHAR